MLILISKQFSLAFTFKIIFNKHWSKLFILFQSYPQIMINLNSSLSDQFLLAHFFTSTFIFLLFSYNIQQFNFCQVALYSYTSWLNRYIEKISKNLSLSRLPNKSDFLGFFLEAQDTGLWNHQF